MSAGAIDNSFYKKNGEIHPWGSLTRENEVAGESVQRVVFSIFRNGSAAQAILSFHVFLLRIIDFCSK